MEPKIDTSKVNIKLNLSESGTSSGGASSQPEKPEIQNSRKRIEVSYQTEIISESSIIQPDGFSSIRLRNIGEDNAKVLDGIPLDPSDPELNLSNDLYCKITDKIRITFAGLSTNKQIVVIKTYMNDL